MRLLDRVVVARESSAPSLAANRCPRLKRRGSGSCWSILPSIADQCRPASAGRLPSRVAEPKLSAKHHYIPKCYLKGWTGDDGRLCEFRLNNHRVEARRKHPSQTGYRSNLYTVHGAPLGLSDRIEQGLFRTIDQAASDCLQIMRGDTGELPLRLRVRWCSFLLSLVQRNPEKVAAMNQRALEAMPALDQSVSTGLNDLAADMLSSFTTLRRVVEHLIAMDWHVVTLTSPRFSILTSDRPLVMTNGIAYDDSHLALPLTSRRVFLATNNERTFRRIVSGVESGESLKLLNDQVVRQALAYAYGDDDVQRRFVSNRLSH